MKIKISEYRLFIKIAASIWGILIILFLIKLFQAIQTASQSAELMGARDTTEEKFFNIFQDKEVNKINKEINWLEQQFLLARTDSLTLSINLRDSIVSIRLKGYAIFQSKIIRQNPNHFLDELSPPNYYHIFGKPSVIISESANIPKKPIKKVIVKTGIGAPGKTELPIISDDRFQWKLFLDNNIALVINGITISADSVSTLFFMKDIFKNNLGEVLKNPVHGKYELTLFLWLSDNDARAIYRALPEKSKVLFLN